MALHRWPATCRVHVSLYRYAVEVIMKVASWLSTCSPHRALLLAAREMCKRREGRADDQLHAAADGRRMARLSIGTVWCERRTCSVTLLSRVLALPVESHPSTLPWTAWLPMRPRMPRVVGSKGVERAHLCLSFRPLHHRDGRGKQRLGQHTQKTPQGFVWQYVDSTQVRCHPRRCWVDPRGSPYPPSGQQSGASSAGVVDETSVTFPATSGVERYPRGLSGIQSTLFLRFLLVRGLPARRGSDPQLTGFAPQTTPIAPCPNEA